LSQNLTVIRLFDPWKSPLCTCPRKYSLHPYTGCSHQCIYCYATSYIGLKNSIPKDGFIRRLQRDISIIPRGSIVELSTSSDPFPPIEEKQLLTRRAIEILARHGFRILITTKSHIVVRDVDILVNSQSAVMITITTLREDVARLIEPGAPSPKMRVEAIRKLVDQGVPVGVRVDPVIPYVNDDPGELTEIVEAAASAGAKHIVTSTYKAKWDSLKRFRELLGETGLKINNLYREKGVWIHGYLYLPVDYRKQLLKPVIDTARKYGLTHATCREGLIEYNRAQSCDGSHLTILKQLK